MVDGCFIVHGFISQEFLGGTKGSSNHSPATSEGRRDFLILSAQFEQNTCTIHVQSKHNTSTTQIRTKYNPSTNQALSKHHPMSLILNPKPLGMLGRCLDIVTMKCCKPPS